LAFVPEALTTEDAVKTYRYLRIGILCAVVLLGASIAIERLKVGNCWQTSISAYYYTPVRAIFVGCLIAIGLALIVIKGRTSFEDICLNVAGMFAPVVAVIPTLDVTYQCFSIPPNPLPIEPDGQLAPWVVTNIANNFNALLLAGAVGLVVATLIALFVNKGLQATVATVDRGTLVSLAATAVLLLAGRLLFLYWDSFPRKAHGYAAIATFAFLIGAVVGKALQHRHRSTKVYLRLYGALALLMPIGGVFIACTRIFGEHTVFALETYEIVLFAIFWIIQTKENWNEGAPREPAPVV
jgi:hypothetical protein